MYICVCVYIVFSNATSLATAVYEFWNLTENLVICLRLFIEFYKRLAQRRLRRSRKRQLAAERNRARERQSEKEREREGALTSAAACG